MPDACETLLGNPGLDARPALRQPMGRTSVTYGGLPLATAGRDLAGTQDRRAAYVLSVVDYL